MGLFAKKEGQPRLVLFFTNYGLAKFVRGMELYGLVQIPKFGGVIVQPGATTPMYSGRVLMPERTPDLNRRKRRRQLVLTANEGNPVPLIPRMGFANNYAPPEKANIPDRETLENVVTEFAKADHAAEGAAHDRLTELLTFVLLIGFLGLAALGGGILALRFMKG